MSIETYRGCDLYYSEALDHDGEPPYFTPCIPATYFWTPTALKEAIDDKLGPVPEPKLPTTLGIDVYPREGTPPYDTWITGELRSEGVPVAFRSIRLFRNDVQVGSQSTDEEGMVKFFDVVRDDSEYYVYFPGDARYEGCPPGEMM